MNEVGIVVKPQGIKGELKVRPLVADPSIFYDFEEVFIDKTSHKIKSVRVHEGFVYLLLNGVDSRNYAEELRGKMLEVCEKSLPPLREGEYYIKDLENCIIYFENGEKVGAISEVNNYGASDVLFIKSGTEEILCPFLPHVFTKIDVENKKIIANQKAFLEVTQSED